jgi:dipeptidyl-peptidase-4
MQSDVNKTLSLQEQLRRERMRLFTQGISTYEWAKSTSEVNCLSRMLIPLNGSVFLFDDNVVVEEEKYRIVYDSKTLGEAVDPHISPDGKLIAFVINDDLYVQSVESEVPIRLTVNGANKGVTCGLADFIAQEEMHR